MSSTGTPPDEAQRSEARPRRVATLALAGLLLASCAPSLPKRVVLVTIDTLRYDTLTGREPDELLDKVLAANYPGYFEHQGERRVTSMPRTLEWSRSAASYEHCYTVSPVTQPAHASLFTGLFPWQHGVTRNGQVLGAEYETVAERLGRAGWKTSAVIASYPLTKRMGLAQGFQSYDDELQLSRAATEWNGVDVDKFYSLGESVTDRALELLAPEESADQFLWVHYFDPHAPYGDTGPDAKEISLAKLKATVAGAKHVEVARGGIKRAQRLYEADCLSLDDQLMRLLERLRAEEDRYETHIVVVADHGESFGEDDSLGHGKRLTEPQLRVPLVIRSARVVAGSYAQPVSSLDVAKTLIGLADLDASSVQGRDLSAESSAPELVAGMRTSFKGELVESRVEGGEVTLVGNRWFVLEGDALVAGDRDAAFHEDDEARPVDGEQAERAKQLFALFADQLTGSVELDDEETRAALEELGYLGGHDD